MNFDQYNDNMLEKLKAFCQENNIKNLVCMLQTQNQQTIIAKVFPCGPGHPFYIKTYNDLTQSVKQNEADWLCNKCHSAFSAEELLIEADGLEFVEYCPYCHSTKIEII